MRYATRDEKDSFVGAWWSATDRGWNGCDPGASAPKTDTALYISEGA